MFLEDADSSRMRTTQILRFNAKKLHEKGHNNTGENYQLNTLGRNDRRNRPGGNIYSRLQTQQAMCENNHPGNELPEGGDINIQTLRQFQDFLKMLCPSWSRI